MKDDDQITDQDIASGNLICFGDPSSNKILARVSEQSADQVVLHSESPSGTILSQPIIMRRSMIYPNPLNPHHYLVINSGFTFRERRLHQQRPPDSEAAGLCHGRCERSRFAQIAAAASRLRGSSTSNGSCNRMAGERFSPPRRRIRPGACRYRSPSSRAFVSRVPTWYSVLLTAPAGSVNRFLPAEGASVCAIIFGSSGRVFHGDRTCRRRFHSSAARGPDFHR